MKNKHLANPTEQRTVRDRVVTVKRDQIKSAWKKSGKRVSLKQFARQILATEPSSPFHEPSRRWLMNKRANPKAPLKGIGRTHKPKAGQKKQGGDK